MISPRDPPDRPPPGSVLRDAEELTAQVLELADDLDELGARVRRAARQRIAEQKQEESSP
jgi:hypothetical protein